MSANLQTLTSLRQSYKGLIDSAHKQMGLRYIRDALRLVGKNPERVQALRSQAAYHLPLAQEISRLKMAEAA